MKETDGSQLIGPGDSPRAASQQPDELTGVQRSLLCIFVLVPLFVVIYFLSFWFQSQGTLSSEQWIIFAVDHQRGGADEDDGIPLVSHSSHSGAIRNFSGFNHADQGRHSQLVRAAGRIYYLARDISIPRGVLPLDWLMTVVAVGGLLAVLRVLHENNWPPFAFFSKKVPTLIVGANEAGESLLYAILRNRKMPYHVVGFIDEDPSAWARASAAPACWEPCAKPARSPRITASPKSS